MAGSTPVSVTSTAAAIPVPGVGGPAVEHPLRGLVRRFSRNWIGMAGALVVLLCIAIAVLAPVLAPYGPEETHPNWKLYPPNEYFLFGTDEFGRDILSRVIF